jgi:cytochrome P450
VKVFGALLQKNLGQWPAFNGGPRTCLGQNLATLEALIAIIHLVKTYRFKLAPQKDITYQISLTLPMKNGLKVFVERR